MRAPVRGSVGERSGATGFRLVAVGVALVLTASLVSACSAVRNSLGTTNGSCFVALPTADRAVGGHGRLVGVRLWSVGALRTVAPSLYRAATDVPGPRITRVCLVAFRGRFRAVGVQDPVGALRGRLAVVEVEYPDKRLLATLLIARRVPLPFGHSHVGVL